MTPQIMADQIVSFVRERGGALFHEIVAAIGPAARGYGVLRLAENVVLWTGVSPLFAEAFQLALPQLEVRRADPKYYAIFSDDDGFPNLPVVGEDDWHLIGDFFRPGYDGPITKVAYDTPRWLPLVMFVKTDHKYAKIF